MPSQHHQQQQQQLLATTSNSSHLSSLRDARRSFRAVLEQKIENRPALDMLQYGNVTLIHKKLDSCIDGKPQYMNGHSCSWTGDHQMMKLEHDHLKCRKEHLLTKQHSSTKRVRLLQRSWSGNISLIQRESLIDVIPNKAATQEKKKKKQTKRTKPRRIGNHLSSAVRAKDVLLDGDIQTVKKVILERKLIDRPLLPNAGDLCDPEKLYLEIAKKERQRKQDINKNINKSLAYYPPSITTTKSIPERNLYRVHSLDRPLKRPIMLMPQSA